jgi:hypothetical protein
MYVPVCRDNIAFCFGAQGSVEEIYQACERNGQWGVDAVAQMLK